MGRTDAVPFTLAWAARARELGAVVDFEPGWDTRSNGQAANYEGGLVHHTAFLSSPGNPFPARSTLLYGRPDLRGPLCNVAGPWCPESAPRLVVISARPGNHAGASGGRSMGPLPVTLAFNSRVFGLEVDYSGVTPMASGQYKAALIFSRAVCDVLGRSSEYIRAHAETSTSGKWDPGYANGKTYDMAAFRRDVTNYAPGASQGDDMFDITRDRKALDETRYLVGMIKDGVDATYRTASSSEAKITALIGAVAALSNDPDLNREQIKAAMVEALRENVVNVDVSVNPTAS